MHGDLGACNQIVIGVEASGEKFALSFRRRSHDGSNLRENGLKLHLWTLKYKNIILLASSKTIISIRLVHIYLRIFAP